MTVKEFYKWAVKNGYENSEIIFDCINGEWSLNPDEDFYEDDGGNLVFEFEC